MEFFKKSKKVNLKAFSTGTIIPLEEVNDEMFSAGLMGPGIAIESVDGKFYSPITGTITMLFPTKHALGIKMTNGIECLLHIGIDTVNLKGEGFTTYVETENEIQQGDLLLEADLKLMKNKGYCTQAILCLTELKNATFEFTLEETVKAKEDTIASINL